MKALFCRGVACLLMLAATNCGAPHAERDYGLALPELPAAWIETLGDPHWRLEWIDECGELRRAVVEDRSALATMRITPYQLAATPVSAAPYWPHKGLVAGDFKSCGAIFPFDAQTDTVRLSWYGGIDAHLYALLAQRDSEKRLPQNFDWPRFRKLWDSEKTNSEARADPWLVDWEALATKTTDSSFAASRIKPRDRTYISVRVPAAGPWVGCSPFAPYFDWKTGELVSIAISDGIQSYFCPDGIFRVKKGVSLFRAWPPAKHDAR